jgi:hypothetical protein
VSAIAHTDVYGVCLLGVCLCLAAYIVFLPFASGLTASRLIRGSEPQRRASRFWRRSATSAPRSSVAERERALFEQLEVASPRESQLDVAVHALPWVAALLIGFSLLALYEHGLNVDGAPGSSDATVSLPTVAGGLTFVGPSTSTTLFSYSGGRNWSWH